jgi:D-galactarolactone isomerase
MSTAQSRPRLKTPPGACDTHMHFYDKRYPTAPTATFTPPDASVADYRQVQARLGLERVVVVQPTTYGKDNRCTLDAIAAIGSNARGIAVVDKDVTDAELERLTKGGIRGVRFHMFPGGVLPWGSLGTIAARVQEVGWHVQLQLDGHLLAEKEAVIRRFPGTLVIDHTGKFIEPVPTDHPAFRVLLRLVENGRTWVKLSAPYETSKVGRPRYGDVGALASVLVRAAPDRMLWASNWPHPSKVPYDPMPDDAELLDLLLDWVPDDATRRKILADNPAQLYGF